MGCNIPRPWKRPPTPSEKEFMEKVINEPLKTPNELRALAGLDPIDEPVLKAFDQFHEAAQDLTYHDTDLDRTIKEWRTNCPNCCAVITGPICEYCGTRFPDIVGDVVIPVYVGGKQVDEVIRRQMDAPRLPIKWQR